MREEATTEEDIKDWLKTIKSWETPYLAADPEEMELWAEGHDLDEDEMGEFVSAFLKSMREEASGEFGDEIRVNGRHRAEWYSQYAAYHHCYHEVPHRWYGHCAPDPEAFVKERKKKPITSPTTDDGETELTLDENGNIVEE
ncbi:hypothetical protein J0H58_19845 [bacterium]|nr:hypothetical protein [bacterium]